MPRDEDEINYELVIREKKQDTSALKSILQQLFSGVGLVVICVFIAIFGKWIYCHELKIVIFKTLYRIETVNVFHLKII